MEFPKIFDIFAQTVMPTYHINNQNSHSDNLKTRKHRLDDYDSESTVEEFTNEFHINKILRTDELDYGFDLLDSCIGETELENLDGYDVELFLKTYCEPQSSVESDKTLAELNRICDEPIKTTEEEQKTMDKELQLIIRELEDITGIYPSPSTKIIKPSKKSETIIMDNLKILFNSLVFARYDFSNSDGFYPEKATVLYEQLHKVNVYINKTLRREYMIYLGFPFYMSIRINTFGKIFVARNDVYKQLEQRTEIDKIHCNSPTTGFNILDVITAEKFIRLVLSKYFSTGFELLEQLLHTIEQYKINSDKLQFNTLKLNFDRFAKLYNHFFSAFTIVPIRDF